MKVVELRLKLLNAIIKKTVHLNESCSKQNLKKYSLKNKSKIFHCFWKPEILYKVSLFYHFTKWQETHDQLKSVFRLFFQFKNIVL